MSGEEQCNSLSLKLLPLYLLPILVSELGSSHDIEERLWFPWELLPIGIITDNGASLLADQLSSLSIDEDQSGDGIHLEP